MPYPETAYLVPHPPRHHYFLLCAGTFRTCASVLCATTQHPHSPPHIRAWHMKYLLQSFVSTRSLRRFADILRPAAPPSWIDFVILSLRYHVVPHGIYHLRLMISAKMTGCVEQQYAAYHRTAISVVPTAVISVQVLDIVHPSHSFCSVRE